MSVPKLTRLKLLKFNINPANFMGGIILAGLI